MTALAGLFAAAFLAATPVPFQSEIPFLALLAAGFAAPALVLVASAGNVAGSCLTYGLGRGLAGFRHHRRFPISPAQLERGEAWFRRWGLWILLLSWAPGGDLVVATAGVLRVPLWQFLILVTIAKTGRYAALAFAAGAVIG